MSIVVLLYILSLCPTPLKAESPERLLVFAAASMADVLPEIGSSYTESSGQEVSFSFAGSSTLARQIDHGAPADVYISANQVWIDYLLDRGRLGDEPPTLFAKGRLVAIAPFDVDVVLEVESGFPFGDQFSGRLAIADPAHVPAGQYAMQALRALGWWDQVSTRLAIGSDVRGALAYVERGACDLGIVYATDAGISDRVKVVATFSDSLHAPIRYLAGVVEASTKQSAKGFVGFLTTDKGKSVLMDAGFSMNGTALDRTK
jgi:molybdate transport system substrate-binding protein